MPYCYRNRTHIRWSETKFDVLIRQSERYVHTHTYSMFTEKVGVYDVPLPAIPAYVGVVDMFVGNPSQVCHTAIISVTSTVVLTNLTTISYSTLKLWFW